MSAAADDSAIVRGADLDDIDEVRRAVRLMGGSLKDWKFVHNVACGLHSGIPLCCVVFWLTVLSGNPDAKRRYDRVKGVRGRYPFPCPRCVIERSFVTVKRCDCGKQSTAHLRRELERLAAARHARPGWVDKVLDGLDYDEPIDDETRAAIDRGCASWTAAIVERYAAPKKRRARRRSP